MSVGQHSLWILTATAALLLLVGGTVQAEGRVYPEPEAVQPLAPGTRVPAVRVETVRGKPVELSKEVRETGALLVFYRGGW